MTIRAEVAQRVAPDIEPTQIEVRVFSDLPSLEIGSVTVRDRLGNQIYFESIPDCGNEAGFTIQLSRRLLPVSVSAGRCRGGDAVELGTFLSPPPGVRPCDPSDPSPAPQACLDAQTRVTALAEAIGRICAMLLGVEASIGQWRQVLVTSLAAAAALFAAAGIATLFGPFGASVAIGLTAAGVLVAAAAVLATIRLGLFGNERAGLLRELSSRQTEFASAAADVRRVCCPHEILVSLDTPNCR